MADEKKSSVSTAASERNRLARKARCAKALAKGKKAGKPAGPQPPYWEASQRKIAKRRSANEKALERYKLPMCLHKSPIPDMPIVSAAAELRATVRLAQAKKAEEAAPAV